MSSGDGAVVLPLLATQILWINLVTDGPPALALGLDPADDGLMDQPPRPIGEGVLTPRMWRGIVFVGVIMAAGTLFVFDASLPGGFVDGSGDAQLRADDGIHDADAVPDVQRRQRAFRRTERVRHLFTNVWLWAAIGGSVALQVAGGLRAVSPECVRHRAAERAGLAALCGGRELGALAPGSEQAPHAKAPSTIEPGVQPNVCLKAAMNALTLE